MSQKLSLWSMLKKVTPKKNKKSPWIPPPGRTKHREKTPVRASDEVDAVSLSDTRRDSRHVEFESFDVVSLYSDSSSGKCTNEENVHLHSIEKERKLLLIHFRSLKRMSLFLNRYFSTHTIENLTIKDLLNRIDKSVKDIIYELDDLEYAVTLVENTLDQENKTQEYLKMVQIKENLLSKVLDCYCKAVTIFETVIQTQSAEEFTKSQQNQEILQKQLQVTEKKCASQNAIIKDFERRLSILQGRTNTIESYKSTLENTRTELEKQLSFKEAQIKYLNTEMSKQISTRHNYEDNEELLEIIEKVKKISSAEKTALKKALKVQKSHTENAKESIEKLKRDLKEKEKIMHSLAGQRDQLKLQLTKAKNNIIEDTTGMQELKMYRRNMKLREELSEKETIYQSQLKKIKDLLNEKTAELNEAIQDKLKLQKEMDSLLKTSVAATNELNTLKSNCSNTDLFLSQSHGDGNQVNALVTAYEVKNLITLLQDTKDCIKSIKTNSMYHSAIEDDNSAKVNEIDSTHKSILIAVEEIKGHLLELKDICDCSNKQNGNAEMEKKLTELEQLYNECSKENESLKNEIKERKSCRFPSVHKPSSDNFVSFSQESDFSTKTLQMELRLKTEENWRIKQREKELEHQLEEVKEKLQRKEIENIRLFSLEEELNLRKNELSLLERKKEEDSEKSQRRIEELQESLNKVTTEYESLKHYVQVLKSSYLNVFGES